MTTVLLTEFRKIASTRMWVLLLLVTAAVSLFGSGLLGVTAMLAGDATGQPSPFSQNAAVAAVYTGGNSIARILAIVAGAMAMGSEYRHKTLSSSYLQLPKRLQLVVGKAIVTFGYGLAFGLVASVIGLLVAIPFVLGTDGSLFLGTALTWRALLLNTVSLALWCMIGYGLGILIRNMIASVLIAIGFAYVLEPALNLVFILQGWAVAANLMPTGATNSLIGVDPMSMFGAGVASVSWPPVAAFFVLLLWGLIPAVVGALTTVRRDID